MNSIFYINKLVYFLIINISGAWGGRGIEIRYGIDHLIPSGVQDVCVLSFDEYCLNRCSIGPSSHHKLDHFMFKLANLLSFNLFQVLLIFISATP